MIFPYRTVTRGGELRFLPIVRVKIHNFPTKTMNVRALVDSGAEHNIFGTDVAEYLGLPLENGKPVHLIGVGEQMSDGILMPRVEMGLREYLWDAPVIFSDAANQRALLGQIGFFEYFTVTFQRDRKQMDIRATKELRFQR